MQFVFLDIYLMMRGFELQIFSQMLLGTNEVFTLIVYIWLPSPVITTGTVFMGNCNSCSLTPYNTEV